jgi:hypothetical protein
MIEFFGKLLPSRYVGLLEGEAVSREEQSDIAVLANQRRHTQECLCYPMPLFDGG